MCAMSEIVRYLHVECQFEAVHYWPGAPFPYKVFGTPHLHVFTCEVRLEVHHNEREVELLDLRREVERFCRERWGLDAASPDSCETMAEAVLTRLCDLFPGRSVKVGVFEMPEAGAWVETQRPHVCGVN